MAQISIFVKGKVKVQPPNGDIGAVGLDLSYDIEGVEGPIPFARDHVCLHGTHTQVRAFAQAILDTVPAVPVIQGTYITVKADDAYKAEDVNLVTNTFFANTDRVDVEGLTYSDPKPLDTTPECAA